MLTVFSCDGARVDQREQQVARGILRRTVASAPQPDYVLRMKQVCDEAKCAQLGVMIRNSVLLVTILTAIANHTLAQGDLGSVYLNNYDAGFGIYEADGKTSALAGTKVEVLGGRNANSMTPIVSAPPINLSVYTLLESDRISSRPGAGSFFDYGYGYVAGVPPLSTGAFQVRAWRGATTYEAALTTPGAVFAASPIWTQAAGTAILPVSQLPMPAYLRIPGALILVPEPSTILIALAGAFAWLCLCRRNRIGPFTPR